MNMNTIKTGKQTDKNLLVFDKLPDAAMIGTTSTCSLLDCSRTTLWRRLTAKTCPPAITYGLNCKRFNVGELRKYMSAPAAYVQPGMAIP